MEIRENLDVYFSLVDDVRNKSYITYKLSDILFLLVCGMLCSCRDLQEIIELGEERKEFFVKYTSLEKIPTLMTLINILNIVKPEELELCICGIFINVFMQNIVPKKSSQICIDGKTIASTVTMKEYEKPIHIVTALLADSYVSLGQMAVDSKSNEIPAVKELSERNCRNNNKK